MVDRQIPLVVCVSADVAVRERVVRRLADLGPVVICADLAELRATLFPDPTPVRPGPPVADAAPSPARTREVPSVPVRFGDLAVDAGRHQVTWRGEPLDLTRLERELLARLASPPVGVWTYERLFGSVWGGAYLGDTAILHSAVKRLRSKLRSVEGGPQVQTVRGVGYRLRAPG